MIKTNAYEYKFHNHSEITVLFQDYAQNFPNKAHLYSIGKTWNNNDIWVLAISDNNPDKHISLRPEVKFISNVHGNEETKRKKQI